MFNASLTLLCYIEAKRLKARTITNQTKQSLSNSSISEFIQTLSQSDKVNMLQTSERCAGSERIWKSNEAFQSLQTFTKIKCFNTDQCQEST